MECSPPREYRSSESGCAAIDAGIRLVAHAPFGPGIAVARIPVDAAGRAHELRRLGGFFRVVGTHADDGTAAAHALGQRVGILIPDAARDELRKEAAAHVDVIAAEAGGGGRPDHA